MEPSDAPFAGKAAGHTPQQQNPATEQTQTRHPIVALWSMPRSRSTAFFRMMAERGDFTVLHEPFSNRAEFGQVEVNGAKPHSEAELIAAIRLLAAKVPVFFKDTTDERYPDLLNDEDFLGRDAVHTFLIRHPAETIASYHALNPNVGLHQIGAAHLHEIHAQVAQLSGKPPIVIDAADIVTDPEGTVRAYCTALGIPFLPKALHWNPGERTEWTATARWHVEASTSTGFTPAPRNHDLDVVTHPVLSGFLNHHLPYYEALSAHRLPPATG